MENRKGKALVSFEEDIRSRGIGSWLRNYTSFVMPSHRYVADVTFGNDSMLLQGRDRKTGTDWFLEIGKGEIIDVHHGFDDVYKQRHEKSVGITYSPLRIRFTRGGQDRSMYLLINVNRWSRGNDNAEWFDAIKTWKEGKRW